ncbi:hypothetical protein GGQ12_002906 [Salinibacter ruber]|nr:hypothetical protein [Salinibacter ruber]
MNGTHLVICSPREKALYRRPWLAVAVSKAVMLWISR